MSDMQMDGIDVSKWQGDVDWNAARKAGVRFAFARATYGENTVDGTFARNFQEMKAAGILRGAYHFYVIGQDPEKQARLFLETASLSPGDLAPALDLEREDKSSTPIPDRATLGAAVQTWLDIVERSTGCKPFIYTNASFWNQYMPATFGAYPLWIAHWGAKAPTLPKGFTNWVLWQYSNTGNVNGVQGAVDLDRSSGSLQPYLVPDRAGRQTLTLGKEQP
jgi:lysozyme